MQDLDRRSWTFIWTALITIAATTHTFAETPDQAEFAKLLRDQGQPLVTVRFNLKVKMGGMMGGMGDQESENEITGTLIDEKGLVICSNSQIGGFTAMMSRFMGPMGGDISATPSDFKILIGDDTEGLDAELIARDSELDLAWVRLKKPSEKALAHVDFGEANEPKIGDRFVSVSRMGKFFGRTPVVIEGRIGGITKQPRDLYIPAGQLGVSPGLPVYSPDGKIVGITIIQTPDAEDANDNPMAFLSQMSGMGEMMAPMILPAADVVKATKLALESASADE